ncbi:50S ribosomal protein L17 [Patescibacteria group bacterium]|nr:50S ribosomal protein L17 [Patescibacteria group bacterium]
MRHYNTNKKFGRVARQRKALLRGLARVFVERERIETSPAKAKALSSFVEKLITLGKKGTLASRRTIISRLGGGEDEAKKIVETLSPRFKERGGGYTRISQLSGRGNESKAVIEFVE